MFQPHSVRGLLSRRSNTRQAEDTSELNTHKDPDLQSTVQAKLMIKDIEHQIDDIRQWRQHQQTLLNQRLASNKAVAEVMMQSYMGNSEKQQQRSQQETKAILSKLKYSQIKEQQQKGPQAGDTNIFDYITNSNQWLQEMKHEVEVDEGVSMMAEQNMISQVQGLGEMVFKNIERSGCEGQQKKNVDKQKLKKQLEQIDAELREVQELLKE